jgi:hypothetical protein
VLTHRRPYFQMESNTYDQQITFPAVCRSHWSQPQIIQMTDRKYQSTNHARQETNLLSMKLTDMNCADTVVVIVTDYLCINLCGQSPSGFFSNLFGRLEANNVLFNRVGRHQNVHPVYRPSLCCIHFFQLGTKKK